MELIITCPSCGADIELNPQDTIDEGFNELECECYYCYSKLITTINVDTEQKEIV